MMRFSLPPRERRALVLGGAVLGTGLLFGKALPAVHRWDHQTRSSAEEAVAEASNTRAQLRSLPEVRDSAAARRRRVVALAPRILDGRSAPEAAASLAALVAGAAARSEVQMGSVEVRYDSVQVGYFVPVRVRADATGSLPGLLRMLGILEGGPETLRISEWTLTQPSPGGAADQPEAIRLDLAVEGLAAPEPPEDAR